MNFATLPPEINSGRMYAGPGPGSMTAAVAAWERLAIRLSTAAADYRAVTSKLAGWGGPASTAMTDAAAPYIDWLDATATQAERAATAAAAAASAHETVLAAMVPPSAINTNRVQRKSLAKANCLGQTSPAIADAEAEYEQMWARDADTMYAYAGASADASTMTPFTSPPTPAVPDNQGAAVIQASGTWTLKSAPEVISAGHQVMSTIPKTLQELSLSPPTTFDKSLLPVTASLSRLSSLSVPLDAAIKHLNSLNKAAALRWLLPNQGGARGAVITAAVGRGASIATLSVPQAWATAATPIPVCRGTVA
ncbi:MAG TPA: PPE family protein [Mycobacterium sp.]|nr:PPE family protein [Mycobacterium sp.]